MRGQRPRPRLSGFPETNSPRSFRARQTDDVLGRHHFEISETHPELAKFGRDALPRVQADRQVSPTIIALNWGYEADHPFEREAALFAKAKIPFYVCPGTSTWQTLIGRHDNALANLRAAAKAGRKHGAIGYLITDWGDGGHPQPLAVSYLPYLAGASLSWCAKTFDEAKLIPVLSRDVFKDPTGNAAKAAFALGLAHRKLNFNVPNETPLGTVIAAPPPEQHELFCRNGLKHHAWISDKNIRATLKEIEKQRAVLRRAKPSSKAGNVLLHELDLAARMAAQSCQFMLWQQARAAGNISEAKRLARTGIRELRKLEKDFNAYWPLRNKATPQHCSAFLKWRIRDYVGVQAVACALHVKLKLELRRTECHALPYLPFTSHASRRPSPRKFSASSVVTSTPPGKAISHQ